MEERETGLEEEAGGEVEVSTEKALQQAPADEEVKVDHGSEIDRLKEALEEKRREAEGNYSRFLRAVADLENYKKRVEKEREEFLNLAQERLIKEILPAVDNLERALGHINDEANLTALREGIKLTLDQMLATLKRFGLEQVSSIGERFDPARHEAIAQEEGEGFEPGVVIKEFQKGYYLKGRLIRPAMVVVSKPPEEVPETEEPFDF
ncbi:MAG: nucleotide exchange factor GrpE [Deltaproteobacteria bacterium]|nr:nucleotide exchange factor GrpE [Deltaproteobacteria bacterium]